MPCTYDVFPGERDRAAEARAAKMKEDLDKLTVELDKTREALIASVEGKEVDAEVLKKVNSQQLAHRKKDLKRLDTTLTAMLRLVRAADPKKPLEPQIGFDPDSL